MVEERGIRRQPTVVNAQTPTDLVFFGRKAQVVKPTQQFKERLEFCRELAVTCRRRVREQFEQSLAFCSERFDGTFVVESSQGRVFGGIDQIIPQTQCGGDFRKFLPLLGCRKSLGDHFARNLLQNRCIDVYDVRNRFTEGFQLPKEIGCIQFNIDL